MIGGERVALILLSAIGDIVHALPLVASIKAALPSVRLEWVVQPVPAEIVRHHPAVDRVWVLDRDRGWRGFRDFREAIRSERFDLVLDLQVYGKASLATALVPSRRKLGFDRDRARELNWLVTTERLPAGPPRHVCEQYLEFADYFGIRRRYAWALPLTADERDAQRDFLARQPAPLAALVVGTSRPDKEWSVAGWTAVAEGLHHELGYAVALVGGGDGRARARAAAIAGAARCPVQQLLRPDLRRLVWILDGCALVVSPDTGPYHLAVALGAPSVGLYGTTDPARVGPNRRCLELVVDAFHDPGEPWHPPNGELRPERMRWITPAAVLDAVAVARSRYPRAVVGPQAGGAEVPGP